MARANVYAGIGLILFGIYFIYEALKFPVWSNVGPGAGALPLAYGSLFVALCLVVTLRHLREGGSGEPGGIGFSRWRIAATILGALFVAILVAKTLGMLITIFLFSAFHIIVVERVRWVLALPISIAIAGMFFLVFERWLDVPLVIGVFGI